MAYFISNFWSYYFLIDNADRNKYNQPNMKLTPPMGVIAPNQPTPDNDNEYKLPLKITIPTTKNLAAHIILDWNAASFFKTNIRMDTASKAKP